MDCKKDDEGQEGKKDQKKITTNKAPSVSFYKKKIDNSATIQKKVQDRLKSFRLSDNESGKPRRASSQIKSKTTHHPIIHRQRSFHSQFDDHDKSPRINGSQISTFCTEEEVFGSIFMIQSPKRDRIMPTKVPKRKKVIPSPRCFLKPDDDQNFLNDKNLPFNPDFASPLGRWKFQSHVAKNHAQNPYHLDLSHRYFSISVLPYGIPPHIASTLTHFTYNADSFGEHELPFFLDTISKLFPNLSNLVLLTESSNVYNGEKSINRHHQRTDTNNADKQQSLSGIDQDRKQENEVQKSCIKRLYILFRLPNLLCLNSIPVTNEEREMARPSCASSQRVNNVNEWLTSKSNIQVSNIDTKAITPCSNQVNNIKLPSSTYSNRSVLLSTNKHNSPIMQKDSNHIQRKNPSSPLSMPVLSSDAEHPTTPKQFVQKKTLEQENEENIILVSPSSSNQMYSPSRNRLNHGQRHHHHANTANKKQELPFMQPINLSSHNEKLSIGLLTPNGTKSPFRNLDSNTNRKIETFLKEHKKSSLNSNLMIPGEKETFLPRNKELFSLQPRSYNPVIHNFLSRTPELQMKQKQISRPPPSPAPSTPRTLTQNNKNYSKRNKILKDRLNLDSQMTGKAIFDNLEDKDDDDNKGESENQERSKTK